MQFTTIIMHYQMKNSFLLLFFFLSLFACDKSEIEAPVPEIEKIIHISHTRENTQGVVHPKLLDIPLANYKMHLLGGDLDLFTSADIETIGKWDELFNFSAPTTLWTLGNHDTSNRNIIEEVTERSSFYTYTAHDICFLVLDTELDLSRITGAQLELVKSVTDTISESKNLIVLTHKLLWLQGNEEVTSYLETVPNGGPGDCGFCTNPNNFYEDVYPLLTEVKNRGVEVWCIAGDIGLKVTEFNYALPEGIVLMASGLNVGAVENKIIEMERIVGEEWSWRYRNIEDL